MRGPWAKWYGPKAARRNHRFRCSEVKRQTDAGVEHAAEIAARAPVAIRLAKEAVNAAFESHLRTGLAHERQLFYTLFATEDQKEGMDAFLNKRKPQWKGR